MILLEGKYVAGAIRSEMKAQVAALVAAGKRVPSLSIVLVGHDPASETYVANKLKACAEVGIAARKIALDEGVSESELLRCVDELNRDASVDGFIVQLPLPGHINEARILSAIDYRKDVDGLTPENIRRAEQGLPSIVSAPARGVRDLMSRYGIVTEGKHVVVIGSRLLASGLEGVTVTECDKDMRQLRDICLSADIIISAADSPRFLTADMVREGAIVIDAGFNRVEDKLVGDVDFENVSPKCAYITPMPGGLGPMTIVGLLQNTLQAYAIHI
ncbi:MAG: bifunctional 5,10-methylenetetrahydrofolate dehydrogenase/5,10-methenyltetrahydrofolate cyclohydrolase [Paludibacteraceae bacterium]|nr:bifunctional 5,10-methylenetetrahydrofolate dehydrogenase/5,10-methenyltetrahydrofolate cyclohydrolase [Paludibacteraceae bacterium]